MRYLTIILLSVLAAIQVNAADDDALQQLYQELLKQRAHIQANQKANELKQQRLTAELEAQSEYIRSLKTEIEGLKAQLNAQQKENQILKAEVNKTVVRLDKKIDGEIADRVNSQKELAAALTNQLKAGKHSPQPSTANTQATVPPSGRVYVVQSGDTLYVIAQAFKCSVSDLKALNNLNSNTIQIGKRLKIPKSR